MNFTERALPHDLEAERATLGASMVSGVAAFDEAREILTGAEFFRDAHRRMWDAMVALGGRKSEIDMLTVKSYLEASGELEQCGGASYVASCSDGLPRAANVQHYARIVRAKHQLRSAIYFANKLASMAYDGEFEAPEVLESAERELFEITSGVGGSSFLRLGQLFDELLDNIEKWQAHKNGITGISSGLAELDAMTRGFQPSNLIILAARPSMGKTALAENIARHAAKSGLVVANFSIEQSRDEQAVRSVSAEGGIDSHAMQAGRMSERAYGRLTAALGELSQVPYYICDEGDLSAFDVRSKARRLRREAGQLDLIVIDYIQLMSGISGSRNENRTMELAKTSRILKLVAKEFKVPVIALSQLSRDLEKRPNKRPILADLRESGALEQDADVVAFLFRPSMYDAEPVGDWQGWDKDRYSRYSELIIGKQRNGPTGTIPLEFDRYTTQFSSVPMGDREVQGSLSGI